MAQEPQHKSNTVLMVAIIGVIGTVIAATITVMGNYNVEKLRQETELTRIAILEQQLSVNGEIATLQANAQNPASAATFIVARIAELESTASALATPQPTTVSVPTMQPTIAPTPTTATVSVPEKSLEYLNIPQVVYTDNFDDPLKGGWGFDIGEIKGGVLQITGQNWRGLSRINRDFTENQGVIVDFIYTPNSDFAIALAHGKWGTDTHKQINIYPTSKNGAIVQGWEGEQYIAKGNLSGHLNLVPDRMYRFLIVVLPKGEFLNVIWDLSTPSESISYRGKIGENWANLTWGFAITANSGTIKFYNYQEIVFDSVK